MKQKVADILLKLAMQGQLQKNIPGSSLLTAHAVSYCFGRFDYRFELHPMV